MDRKTCKICKKVKPGYLMQNKLVCLTCDELLFDMEIELDDTERTLVDISREITSAPNKTSAGTRN